MFRCLQQWNRGRRSSRGRDRLSFARATSPTDVYLQLLHLAPHQPATVRLSNTNLISYFTARWTFCSLIAFAGGLAVGLCMLLIVMMTKTSQRKIALYLTITTTNNIHTKTTAAPTPTTMGEEEVHRAV